MNPQAQRLHERIDRWRAFFEPDAPPGFLFLVRKNEPDWPARPPLWPEHRAARVEWILAHKTGELLTAFLDEWFRRYGVSFVAHHPDYFMPRGITLSEDEIGAVNSDMFEEFFLPELNALSDRYGGIGIHSCACARHQWDGLARLRNARLLNIANHRQDAAETYAFFARTAAQMHHGIKDAPPEELPGQYPADARVVIETGWMATREEAERAAEALTAARAACAATRMGAPVGKGSEV